LSGELKDATKAIEGDGYASVAVTGLLMKVTTEEYVYHLCIYI
jgi:hypothetical protein